MRMLCCHILSAFLLFQACGEKSTENKGEEKPTVESLSQKMDRFGGTADDYHLRAKLWLEKGDLQKAADDITNALQQDSNRVEFFHTLSDIQLNGYRSREALKTLEYAANRYPENRLTLLKLLETQILLRQYMPALNTSQLLLLQDPQDHEAFFLRGLMFKEQGLDSLAIVNLQRAVDLDQSLTSGFIILGDLHERMSDPLAEGYYQNAVKSDPDNINALHALAFYQQNHDKTEEAIDHYNRIIELDSTFQPAYVNRGILLLEKDSLNAARYDLEQSLKLDSTFVIALYYMGLAEKELGNQQSASDYWNKALEIDPEYNAPKEALQNL